VRKPLGIVILLLALTASSALAQQVSGAFAIHPYLIRHVTRETLHDSRFWTRSTIALVALDGAAKTADSFATRENIAGGGLEYDPVARPFVHTTAVQVVATAALFGAEIAGAYLLHKRDHNYAARGVLIAGAVANGLGAATSFKDRVGSW
jgi:hypothetical protein